MNWALVWELAKTDFKLRYAGSVFGYLWGVLKPLCLFLILLAVFSQFFRSAVPHYGLHLLTGIILWTYFAEGTKAGLTAFLAQAQLLKNISFPRAAAVWATTVHVSITFAINVALLLIVYATQGLVPGLPALIFFAVLSVAVAGLITGINFALAPVHVLLRDLSQIWELILQLGFFAAPIIYPLSLIPQGWQWMAWLNPAGYLIHLQREVLLHHSYPSGWEIGWLTVIVAGVGCLGWIVFHRFEHIAIEHL